MEDAFQVHEHLKPERALMAPSPPAVMQAAAEQDALQPLHVAPPPWPAQASVHRNPHSPAGFPIAHAAGLVALAQADGPGHAADTTGPEKE